MSWRPRSPTPIAPKLIRSFAPITREYDAAVMEAAVVPRPRSRSRRPMLSNMCELYQRSRFVPFGCIRVIEKFIVCANYLARRPLYSRDKISDFLTRECGVGIFRKRHKSAGANRNGRFRAIRRGYRKHDQNEARQVQDWEGWLQSSSTRWCRLLGGNNQCRPAQRRGNQNGEDCRCEGCVEQYSGEPGWA